MMYVITNIFLFQQKAYNDIVRGAAQSLKDIMLD